MILLTLLALAASTAHAEPQADLDALVDTAIARRPRVQAADEQAGALREAARVAGTWSDPQAMVEWSNVRVDNPTLSGHPMSGLQLRLQQALHLPGWSRAARQVGEAAVAGADHASAEAALQAEVAVRHPWWRLVRERLQARVTRSHLGRTESLLEVARSRYATGAIGQHAVLRLSVQRDVLREQLADHDAAESGLHAELALALGGTEPPELAIPDQVTPLPPPEQLPPVRRPLVQAVEARAELAEATAHRHSVDARPDVSVWAGYRLRTIDTAMDDGADLIALGFGVPLPVASLRRATGERASALADARAHRLLADDLRNELLTRWQGLQARWQRSYDKARAYETRLLPSARAMLETTRSDFSTGRAGMADLLEAERALLDLERQRIDAVLQTRLLAVESLALLGSAPTPGGTQ